MKQGNPFDFKIDRPDYIGRKEPYVDWLELQDRGDKFDLRVKRMLFQHLLSTKRAINYLQNLSDETLRKAEMKNSAQNLESCAYVDDKEREIDEEMTYLVSDIAKEIIEKRKLPELFSYPLLSFCKRSLRGTLDYYSGKLESMVDIFFDENLGRYPILSDVSEFTAGTYASTLRHIAKTAWDLEKGFKLDANWEPI